MARTIDGVIEWAKSNPLYTYKEGALKGQKKSWAGLCEAFVNNAGGFNESFGSAILAGNASGYLNPDWTKAPRGAIHMWAGVGGDGHTCFELGGGYLLMVSSRLGTAPGIIHFTDYGLPLYRGWTMRHGTETLAGASTAGLNTNDLENDMATPLEFLLAAFDSGQKNADGSPRMVNVAESLRATYYYGDLFFKLFQSLPADVWAHTLVHPLAKPVNGQPARVAAGELLRYEPAEHDSTRRAVAAAVGKGANVDIDYDELVASLKGSGLDPAAIAVYSADEADRRERARLAK